MSEAEETAEETAEESIKVIGRTHAAPDPARRYVYLAGPVEVEDTWRKTAAKALGEMGFEALDPMRGEDIKAVGKHVVTDYPDALVVERDLNDLERVRLSGGLCIMNFNTTKDGRRPGATWCELENCRKAGIPVIAIVGRNTHPATKNNPWVKVLAAARVTSLKAALELIEAYFI